MDRLLYVAMTGAQHIDLAQTVHANNLANVSTTGFRADLAQARAVQVYGEGYQGRVYALAEEPSPSFAPGAKIDTGRELDVAIEGEGFIAVQTADGREAYTRAGDFLIDADGILRTGRGHIVLGDGGAISLPPITKLTIGADGTITVQPQGQGTEALSQIATIKLVKPAPDDLTKGPDGLLRRRDGGVEPSNPEVHLVSGFLEGSNVNAVQEMTAILELARQFEIEVRMMRAVDDNAEAATSLVDVGG
jgi:flagellar basal-body rod protein FlgF